MTSSMALGEVIKSALPGFEVMTQCSMRDEIAITVATSAEVRRSIDPSAPEFIREVFNVLRKKFDATIFASEFRDRIKFLEKGLAERDAEIARLKRYETYVDVKKEIAGSGR